MKFKQVLLELPYFEINNDKIFDLEIEKYNKTPDELIKKIINIINGKAYIDKYGNSILLKNSKDKKKFWIDICNDILLKNILTRENFLKIEKFIHI
jgi:hypothetical protein